MSNLKLQWKEKLLLSAGENLWMELLIELFNMLPSTRLDEESFVDPRIAKDERDGRICRINTMKKTACVSKKVLYLVNSMICGGTRTAWIRHGGHAVLCMRN